MGVVLVSNGFKFDPDKSLLEAIRETRTAKLAKESAKTSREMSTRQAQAVVNDPLKRFFEAVPTPAKAIKQARKEEKQEFKSAILREQPATPKPSADPRQQLNLRDIAVKKDIPAPARQVTKSAGAVGDVSNFIADLFSNIFGGRR